VLLRGLLRPVEYIRPVRYSILRDDVKPVSAGGGLSVLHLFDDSIGCEMFAQRVLRFEPGPGEELTAAGLDEVLYVLSGSGFVSIDGRRAAIAPGTGIHVSQGCRWAVEALDELEVLAVAVRDPEPVAAGTQAVVDLEAIDKGTATAGRQFTLGICPGTGCPSVTQFIGYIPPGRAPDHFHRYDEVIYILEGQGTLHIGGEEAPLHPGACVHLPRLLVHSLENSGEGELRLLGVFRPGGSPAEAYYPDGTPAAYPES